MKKQLEEKENALSDAEKLCKDLTETVRKLRADVNSFQSRCSAAEKNFNENKAKTQQEVQVLRKELQKERDQGAADAAELMKARAEIQQVRI